MSASNFSIYKAIIQPLREADDTQLLKRFLIGPQTEHDRAEAAILSLPDQIKPDKIREDLLQYLLPIVGFTSELRNITDRLTTAQLRRLVTVAVPLWNQRHTRSGLINGIRLLTGRTAIVSDWFTYRALLGEVQLMEDQLSDGGDFWIIGGSISIYDEFLSNIRVMDDGTLDELLLLDVCKLMRPLDERFEVFVDDFLDHFDGILDKWVNLDGGSVAANGSIDTITFPNTLELVAGGSLAPIVPLIPNSIDHHDYNVACKINIPTNGQFSLRWYTITTGGGTAYELVINATTGLGTLSRWIGGVQTTIQASVSWPLTCKVFPGVWYALRVAIVNNDATTRSIRILIDGNQAVPVSGTELIDSPGASPSSGPYVFSNIGATPIWIDNVESWRNPARFALIGISTITDRGGAVTMTSNFVQ